MTNFCAPRSSSTTIPPLLVSKQPVSSILSASRGGCDREKKENTTFDVWARLKYLGETSWVRTGFLSTLPLHSPKINSQDSSLIVKGDGEAGRWWEQRGWWAPDLWGPSRQDGEHVSKGPLWRILLRPELCTQGLRATFPNAPASSGSSFHISQHGSHTQLSPHPSHCPVVPQCPRTPEISRKWDPPQPLPSPTFTTPHTPTGKQLKTSLTSHED